MTIAELRERILATASRRTIYASVEARQLKSDVAAVRRAISTLRQQKLIYRSSDPIKNYFGSSEAGYRAVPSSER